MTQHKWNKHKKCITCGIYEIVALTEKINTCESWQKKIEKAGTKVNDDGDTLHKWNDLTKQCVYCGVNPYIATLHGYNTCEEYKASLEQAAAPAAPVLVSVPRLIRVYYADAYSSPYPIYNIRNAMLVWKQLWDFGYIPTCPHWTGFQDLMTPMPYESWLEYDSLVMRLHHAVLRGPSKSSGADKECELARGYGMPIYLSLEDLISHMPADIDTTTLYYNPTVTFGGLLK